MDPIKYDAQDLIKAAAKLNYDVLTITCHNKIIFSKKLEKYAHKKGLLLIPGIETEINKKHILIINADKSAEEIHTFEDLKKYKTDHPESLIVAPHPFFPGINSLKKDLIKNIDLFDAIEYSFCYTKLKNYNLKAEAVAKKYSKPIIATSDCHFLQQLPLSFAMLDSHKDIPSIINAIKKNKIKNYHFPLSIFKLTAILSKMFMMQIKKINYRKTSKKIA
ncbi:MAG: PHP-associated domain-containing protein [Candidatus Gracilibacteria bacterium]|jgi:predicted metal-dependent phosphoesterase TrpH